MYKEAVTDLVTIKDFIRWGASKFSKSGLSFGHGTNNAMDESIALIFAALGLPRDFESFYWDTRLTESERITVTELFHRRIEERKPLAYLTNEAWFAGLCFYVDERVLVPRSPIAELIENGFEPWLRGCYPERILDLCTGSGCIAIACAYAFQGVAIDAIDISEDALKVAERNVDDHGVADFVTLIKSDLFAEVEAGVKYDLIVSNPPYVDALDMDILPVEYKHEPEIGLAAGEDGLDLVHEIFKGAKEHLSDDGYLIVEVGNSQQALLEAYPHAPFYWFEFERGGHGVFLLSAKDLKKL